MKMLQCVQELNTQLRRLEADVHAEIRTLFGLCPDLIGFSLEDWSGLPSELFISDIGFSAPVSEDQYGEIYDLIRAAVAEFLSERPEAFELLRRRTFARTLH
jgi:hypothetical protein